MTNTSMNVKLQYVLHQHTWSNDILKVDKLRAYITHDNHELVLNIYYKIVTNRQQGQH